MSEALQKIKEELRGLSLEELEQLRRLLDDEYYTRPRPRPSRELIESIAGSMRDVLTSSDEFAARKDEEIELEDRRMRK